MDPVFISTTTMHQEDIWTQALLKAIDEYLRRKTGGTPAVVPAAPLKPLLLRHAELLGLSFPPEGYERSKFVDFLNQFPTVVRIYRRVGQDALVVKITDVQLLEKVEEAHRVDATHLPRVLRQDLFRAFTEPPMMGCLYWYSTGQDRFIQATTGKPDWITIPSPSADDAIIDRKTFVETLPDTTQKEALLAALSEQITPLKAFGAEIKKQDLGHLWHTFRLKCILTRVSDWSKSNGVPWNTSWESHGEPATLPRDIVTAREVNAFLSSLMQLGPEDAKRVMIPLDIVLRLIRHE